MKKVLFSLGLSIALPALAMELNETKPVENRSLSELISNDLLKYHIVPEVISQSQDLKQALISLKNMSCVNKQWHSLIYDKTNQGSKLNKQILIQLLELARNTQDLGTFITKKQLMDLIQQNPEIKELFYDLIDNCVQSEMHINKQGQLLNSLLFTLDKCFDEKLNNQAITLADAFNKKIKKVKYYTGPLPDTKKLEKIGKSKELLYLEKHWRTGSLSKATLLVTLIGILIVGKLLDCKEYAFILDAILFIIAGAINFQAGY